eukprot:1222407-Rhodomonas_salina.1
MMCYLFPVGFSSLFHKQTAPKYALPRLELDANACKRHTKRALAPKHTFCRHASRGPRPACFAP